MLQYFQAVMVAGLVGKNIVFFISYTRYYVNLKNAMKILYESCTWGHGTRCTFATYSLPEERWVNTGLLSEKH